MAKNRANLEWVSITEVVPNPLNPRRNDAIKTEEMQTIIKRRGWEEPLTVYKKGAVYVVLSGHRRLFAAKQAEMKEVPVYITEKPESYQEELDRIASLQSGRVDWTPFEWAQFVYNRWLAWDRPPFSVFAKELNLKLTTVKRYVKVMDYYPSHEIESGLKTGVLTFSTLERLIIWLEGLKNRKPTLVESMTADLIRGTMLDKVKRGTATKEALKITALLNAMDSQEIKTFLLDKEARLDLHINKNDLNQSKYKSFHGNLVAAGMFEKRLRNFDIKTKEQKEKALQALEELNEAIERKIRELENKYKDETGLNLFNSITNQENNKK